MQGMKRVHGRKWWVVVFVVLTMGIGVTVLQHHVQAISNNGPDKAEFGGANVSYYLANTDDVSGAKSTGIPIYLDTAPGSNVRVTFWCDDRPRGIQVDSPVAGASSPWTMCDNNSGSTAGSFWVPASEFHYNADSKKYKALVKFSLISDSNRRGFRLGLPDGGLIGYSSADNDERFAILNQDRCRQANDDGCGNFFTYSLPFAAPCTADTGTASIIVYDPDNDASSSDGAAQYSRTMSAYVEDIDTGIRQNFSTPSSGNGMTDTFVFTHTKGHRYNFVLTDVYTNNVIQFKLPYDSINAASRCGINNLLPSTKIKGVSMTTLSLGESVVPTEIVHNSGEKADYSSRYGAYQFVIPRGKSFPLAGVFNQSIDGYAFALANYADAGEACNDWLRTLPGAAGNIVCQSRTANGSLIFDRGDTSITDAIPIRADDYSLGDIVCRMLAVRSFDFPNMSTAWRRVSYPACVKIAKRPTVQIWGNDTRVGSATSTSANIASSIVGGMMLSGDGATGSWGEYGVIAPDSINGFSSGSGFNRLGLPGAQSAWSKLTFSNTAPTLGQFGAPLFVGGLPDMEQYFGSKSSADTTVYSGNHIISAYSPGVHYVKGTVIIDRDIVHPNPTLLDETTISQMVIIATGNIIIRDTVQTVNAWLVASAGYVSTCDEHLSDQLTTNICGRPLIVTGPIVAKQLFLRRTAGNARNPAEVIDLRSDAFLWAHRVSVSNGKWVTRSLRELSPRY